MKSLYQLSVLCVLLADLVICQYQWACTAPNESGQRYIPSERNRNVVTATTDGNSLHIYRVPTLDANCYSPVTAIEYCYRYSTSAGAGLATFNWTVLILEEAGSNFVINRTCVIQSSLPADSANCTSSGTQVTCCDRTNIDRFDLSMNLIFGVTESTQGNTHRATLLGYHDALPQYWVATVLLNKAGLTLSVGSTVSSAPVAQRGLRMLWFIVGITSTTSPPTVTDSLTSTDAATDLPTTEPINMESTDLSTTTTNAITTTTKSPMPTTTDITDSPTSTADETTVPTDSPTSTIGETTDPTDSPMSTADETTDPTDSPTSTADETTDPTDSPASTIDDPTDSPTSTIDETTDPTDSPTSTADETTDPTDSPTSTADETTDPTDSPTSTIDETTDPTDSPTSTADETTDPTDSPMSTADETTDPDTDLSTQSTMILTSTFPMTGTPESGLVSSNFIAPVVGGAVGGLILVIVIIVVVIIALLVIKRGQKGSMMMDEGKVSLQAYNNALYSAGTDSDPSNLKIHLDVPGGSVDLSNVSYDYVAEQTQIGHDYSIPDEIHNGKMHTKQETPHIASVCALAYENPVAYETSLSQTEIGTEDIYMVPATNEDALYSQLSQIKINNVTRDSIKLTELLGAGQFGNVHLGEWTVPGSKDKINVAVKTLKEGASEEDKVKFLQEAAIMGQFSHPNVVKLYGVVTEGEPVMLLIELLPKGDLREVLCSVRSEPSSEVKIDADLPHTLLSYCRQVASGMNYLSNKLFIHRDLAARNILVSEDGVCKIADFGMSRDLADTNYYVAHGGKIPVKWTAPEAILYKKYSTASDVWSLGCVMYEIWSLGHKPFEQYTNQDCIKLIDKGVRLPPPTGCPRAIYKLMIGCWHPEPSSRPDFVSVAQQLSLPDTKLLKWSEEDKATDPEAATLGAGLDKAVDLYKDLQQRYVTN